MCKQKSLTPRTPALSSLILFLESLKRPNARSPAVLRRPHDAWEGNDNRVGTETSSHTTRTWEGSEPRKDQPTDARMPVSHYLGPVPCPAWACASYKECSHTCLSPAPSFLLNARPRATS